MVTARPGRFSTIKPCRIWGEPRTPSGRRPGRKGSCVCPSSLPDRVRWILQTQGSQRRSGTNNRPSGSDQH